MVDHRRVTSSNGRPLSSVIPFKTKNARKRFLKANDQFSTIQLYGLGAPVALYIAPPNHPEEELTARPPSKGRNARRHAYKRDLKSTS